MNALPEAMQVAGSKIRLWTQVVSQLLKAENIISSGDFCHTLHLGSQMELPGGLWGSPVSLVGLGLLQRKCKEVAPAPPLGREEQRVQGHGEEGLAPSSGTCTAAAWSLLLGLRVMRSD